MKVDKAIQEEFLTIIKQHEKLVYKVVNIYTDEAESGKDLFQEIILQAWLAYRKFEGRSKVSTWLYRVSLNTAINYQRKRSRQPDITFTELIIKHPTAYLNETEQEQYKLLQQLISALPKLDKALILLYLEDKSYKEIAEIIGISSSNVGTKLNRIKDRLKKEAQPYVSI